MRSSRALPVLTFLVLAGCTGGAPQPGVSTAPLGSLTPLSVREAEAAVEARLGELGFTVEQSLETGVIFGVITNRAPAEWADCDRVRVVAQDDGNRMHWADADDWRARVTVRFSELGGQTSVTLTPRLDGVYLDRFDNLPFDRACSSTGVLERQLLTVVGGA